ncbi:MAG: UDP-N-acetylmuramoyl-L-alanine--D-glutamate ligase [Vicinamibacterales bacterium]
MRSQTPVHERFTVAGDRVVVLGAARSGLAAAELLAARGAHVTLSDLRETIEDRERLEALGISLELGRHELTTLLGATLIVLSPGVSPFQPVLEQARTAGVPVIGELELASRWFEGPIVAITGTKGKSTTTTLVGRMLVAGGLKTCVGGNLGPAASLQVTSTSVDTFHVIEASSFQLEVIDTFHPRVAVFLNFSPDHLDRHRSEREYADAKTRIFQNQTADDFAIVNADDETVMAMARGARATCVKFSHDTVPPDGLGIRDGMIGRQRGETFKSLVPVSSVRLLGRHLLGDVIAAAGVADLLGVAPEAITAAVEGFTGLEHALEPVATIDGVQFVNDSKATNIEAARRAIEAFDRGVVAIVGGRFKGGDVTALAEPVRARGRAVVTIGESGPRFRDALAPVVPVVEAYSMAEAVREAWRLARPDGVVVLAPGCSSFDMFRDYAERGRVFKEEVARLASHVR